MQGHILVQLMQLTHRRANSVHLVLFLQQQMHQVPPRVNLALQVLLSRMQELQVVPCALQAASHHPQVHPLVKHVLLAHSPLQQVLLINPAVNRV